MDALKAKTRSFSRSAQTNEATDAAAAEYGGAGAEQFLNAVFARKSFSWTAVMMDLERVLPAGCR